MHYKNSFFSAAMGVNVGGYQTAQYSTIVGTNK